MVPLALLMGCTTTSSSSAPTADTAKEGVTDRLLDKIGLQRSSLADAREKIKQPYSVEVLLTAGENLNAGNNAAPHSVVVKLYQLRSAVAVERLTLLGAQSPELEKQQLGEDLIAAREVILIPKQQLVLKETLPREANVLVVAALFHAAAERRWRFAFSSDTVQKTGITIGLHACAMTVSRGAPLSTAEGQDDAKLARTRCAMQ